jgi:hypothetical protein
MQTADEEKEVATTHPSPLHSPPALLDRNRSSRNRKKRETSTAAETRKGELSLRKTRLLGHRHYFGKGFVPPYINRYVYSFTSSMGTFALLLLASWSVAHARQIPSPDARLSPRPPRLPFWLSLSRVHARLRRFCRPKP